MGAERELISIVKNHIRQNRNPMLASHQATSVVSFLNK